MNDEDRKVVGSLCKAEVEEVKKVLNTALDKITTDITTPLESPLIRIKIETLLKEVHNVDNLLESHSRISLAVSGGLLGFAFSPFIYEVWPVAVFGVIVTFIWLLKANRYNQIFTSCRDRLSKLNSDYKLDAIRPKVSWSSLWMSGFQWTQVFIIGALLVWGAVLLQELHWLPVNLPVIVKSNSIDTRLMNLEQSVKKFQEESTTAKSVQELREQVKPLSEIPKQLTTIEMRIEKLESRPQMRLASPPNPTAREENGVRKRFPVP